MRIDLRRRGLHSSGLFLGPAPGGHRRRSSRGDGGQSGHSERGEEIDPGDEVTDGQTAHFLQKDFEDI
jgi:hypothetical protein